MDRQVSHRLPPRWAHHRQHNAHSAFRRPFESAFHAALGRAPVRIRAACWSQKSVCYVCLTCWSRRALPSSGSLTSCCLATRPQSHVPVGSSNVGFIGPKSIEQVPTQGTRQPRRSAGTRYPLFRRGHGQLLTLKGAYSYTGCGPSCISQPGSRCPRYPVTTHNVTPEVY